jgi:adenylate cyclase
VSVQPVERKLAAIFAADIAGYSRLMARDEVGTLARLKACRAIIDALIASHRGRIFNTAGDSVVADFASAVDAVQCAVAVQAAIATENAGGTSDEPMQFRIGVHVGDVMVDGDNLLGDGVNIASRLESLGDPGTICVSAAVRDQVGNKLPVAFDDLGYQQVKNIAQAIRVYRVQVEKPTAQPAAALPLPDKPSLAVLAFHNMSGDPEQEYFADGIAEDIITALSKSRWLFVIARNSSFAYKGRSVDIKQIARELGVRYVLEGSVRKAGNRVRITGQLIEADTGAHLWGERYDRDLTDIFEVQDEITSNVTMAIEPALSQAERQRVMRKPPDSLDAWEAYHRGLWHFLRQEPAENERAKTFFQRAIDRDPGFAPGYYGLALCHGWDGWVYLSRPLEECAGEARRLAQRAVALDDADAMAHIALAEAFGTLGDVDGATLEADRAIAINPNHPWALGSKGGILALNGHPREALAAFETAMRTSPHDPLTSWWMHYIAVAHFFAHEYEEAVAAAERLIRFRPDVHAPYRFRAAALGHLGRLDEAREALQAALDMDVGQFRSRVSRRPPWQRPVDYAVLIDGLRKAGWTGTVE